MSLVHLSQVLGICMAMQMRKCQGMMNVDKGMFLTNLHLQQYGGEPTERAVGNIITVPYAAGSAGFSCPCCFFSSSSSTSLADIKATDLAKCQQYVTLVAARLSSHGHQHDCNLANGSE